MDFDQWRGHLWVQPCLMTLVRTCNSFSCTLAAFLWTGALVITSASSGRENLTRFPVFLCLLDKTTFALHFKLTSWSGKIFLPYDLVMIMLILLAGGVWLPHLPLREQVESIGGQSISRNSKEKFYDLKSFCVSIVKVATIWTLIWLYNKLRSFTISSKPNEWPFSVPVLWRYPLEIWIFC